MRKTSCKIALCAIFSTLVAGNNSYAWSVDAQKSRKSDATNVILSVASNEVTICQGREPRYVDLQLRCTDGEVSLVFVTGCRMLTDETTGYNAIQYQLDGGDEKIVFGADGDHNASIGIWDQNQALDMKDEMVERSVMSAKITPYGDKPITVTFDISKLETALKPVRKACSW